MPRQINKVISLLLTIIFATTALPGNALALRPAAYRLKFGLSTRMPENSYPADYHKKIEYFKAWLEGIKAKNLTQEIHLLHVINILIGNLENMSMVTSVKDTGYEFFTQGKTTLAVKSLAVSGLIDSKTMPPGLLARLNDNLQSNNVCIRAQTSYDIKDLADVGLLGYKMISENIIDSITNNLNSASMPLLLNTASVIESIVHTGLFEREKLKNNIPLNAIISHLKSSASNIQLSAAIALSSLARTGLLDIEGLRSSIPLEQLMDNLHISSSYRQADAAKAIRHLSDAGLLDEERFSQLFQLKRLVVNLENKDPLIQLYATYALRDLTAAGLIDKRQLKNQISLANIFANLKSSSSTTLLYAAEAVAPLADIGLLDAEQLKKQISSHNIIRNLQSKDLYKVSKTANAIQILAGIGLVDKEMLKKHIRTEHLNVNFQDGILDAYTQAVIAVKSLAKAGLLDKDMVSGPLIENLIDGLSSNNSSIQAEAAGAIEYIARAGLLDKEKVKTQISLNQIIYNLTDSSSSVQLNAAISAKSLADAGLLDKEKLIKNIPLVHIIDNLQSSSAFTQAEAADTVKCLADAGLLENQSLKNIIGFLRSVLSVPEAFMYYYLRVVEHLKDDAKAAYNIFNYLNPVFLDIAESIKDRKKESYFYKWLAKQIREKEPLEDILSGYIRDHIGLSSIEFRDGGNSFNSSAKLAEIILKQADSPDILQAPGIFPMPEPVQPQDIPIHKDFKTVIPDDYYLYGAQGRTLIYKNNADGPNIAFKILKQDETASYLAYESIMLEYLNTHKKALGLKSSYPKPYLINGNRLIKAGLGKDALKALKGQAEKSSKRLDIDTAGGYYTLIAYITEDNSYFTYLREPDIEPELFNEALLVSMHDLFTLARYGIIHTALIELFHNLIQNDRQDEGKYLWMIDIIQDIWMREGAGRLHAWTSAVEYPNMRLSGLADFPDLYLLKDLIQNNNPVSSHMHTLSKERPGYNPEVFYLASYLGDYMLSAALITGRYMRDRDALDWRNPDALADIMQECYVTGFSAFTGLDRQDIYLLSDMVDWEKLARQMALMMAKGNGLAEHLLNNNIPEKIYGPDTRIYYSNDYISSRGWINTAQKKGWYFDGENPDLGPTNGPNPLQELIKANYIFTAFSLSGRMNNFSSVYNPALQQNTPQIINALSAQPAADMEKSFFTFEYKKAIAIKQAA